MTRKVPIVSTLVVLLAVALMVRLGFWQIDRLHQKEALLALLARNPSLATMDFPARSTEERLFFRHARLDCESPGGIDREGAGRAGTRMIATCANGAKVQLGTSLDPRASANWQGGVVQGVIGQVPDHRPLIETAFAHSRPELMLVADPPLGGLQPNVLPDESDIPNNHLSYAVQWFLFAATALVIYTLALRKRWKA